MDAWGLPTGFLPSSSGQLLEKDTVGLRSGCHTSAHNHKTFGISSGHVVNTRPAAATQQDTVLPVPPPNQTEIEMEMKEEEREGKGRKGT